MRPALISVALLTAACAGLLWITDAATSDRIDAARAKALRADLSILAGGARLQGLSNLQDWPLQLCDGVTLVRAQGRGYGGAIALVLALQERAHLQQSRSAQQSGTAQQSGSAEKSTGEIVIDNLRVVAHRETPGIGDFIADSTGARERTGEPDRGTGNGQDNGPWLARFRGQTLASLLDRPLQLDAVSGATITVRAVRKALVGRLHQASAATDLFTADPCT